MQNDPLFLLKGQVQIPSLPTVYTQINEAIDSPRTSIADIGKIISRDSGLTARLLRLANSAFYGFPQKIDTIVHALVIIGTRELRDLVLATMIISLFENIPEELVTMRSFWQHSIACGLTARILAVFRSDTSVERYFVAGLLHDIGRLLIYEHLPEKAREVFQRSRAQNELLYKTEKELLGFDHTDIGRMVLKKWNIPENLQEMVAYHHHPSGAQSYSLDAAVVHVADIIANTMQLGTSGERFVPPLDARAWDQIALKPSVLGPVLDQLEKQFAEVLNSIFPEQKND